MEERIPKIIHYVWLGGEKSELAEKCIKTWKEACPDFEIREWNESNFDVNSHPFLKAAYENKKWAFASDYIRLAVLEEYGGIYLDVDVEILKDLTPLLENEAFFGFEHESLLQTSTFGCIKHHPYIKEFLKTYDKKQFIKKNGKYDTTPNTEVLTVLLQHLHNLKVNNTYQELENCVTVYTNDYFCPKNYMTGKIRKTENTFAVHHFDGSWLKESRKKSDKFLGKIVALIGEKTSNKFSSMYFKSHLKNVWKKLNIETPNKH